jgi:hypothetical protein
MSHRTGEPRLDNFFSWFAASVLVTAGIIYGLKLQDDRHQRPHAPVLPPRATPAQEPLTLQLRLERYYSSHLSPNPG